MNSGQRIAFALVAVLIAVGAFVLLGNSSGEDDEWAATATATTPAATATPSPEEPSAEAQPEETPTPTATPTPRPKPEVKVVRFEDGKVVGGVQRLTFDKGETARFAIASDEADEIHVHGYDLYKDVPAGGRAAFRFPADIEGIFEVELHGRGIQVAQLRVEP